MNRKLAIDILREKSEVILRCNGNSMQPIMKPGDALHIRKVDNAKYRVGDAVFCKIHGGLQVHKISAIKDHQWQISNNNNYVNGWIGENSLFGLCVKVENRILIDDAELNNR